MQPVNVLPTFVSQDADLKTKESSDSSEGRNKETEFARLVDKHVDDENSATTRKQPKSEIEAVTANAGKAIAGNGNNETERQNSRQESDFQAQTSEKELSKDSNDSELNHLATKLLTKESEKGKDNRVDNKALDDSEQFISLLYNSDQTLTNADAKAGGNIQPGNTNSQQTNAISNDRIDRADKDTTKEEVIAKTDEGTLASQKNNAEQATDHRLKAFSKDELLARAQAKRSNVLVQQPNTHVLKDYQQLLQSKQGVINNQSITNEQLTHSPLANTQLTNEQLANAQLESAPLKGNKIPELAATIAQTNKGLLNEQVNTALYQLPVESIGKDKQSVDDLLLSGKEPVANISEKGSEKKSEQTSQLSAKSIADVRLQLATEISEEPINTDTKATNNLSEFINNKASNGEGNINAVKSDEPNSRLTQSSQDKVNGARTAQSVVIGDATTRESSLDTQTKQPAITNVQVQALQQVQTQQKEHLVDSDSKSVEDAGDEYANSMNFAQGKTQEQGVNTSNKVTDNVVPRSISEIQSQAIQSNQIKKNNDAYIEHQASEVLNHTVASDTAQIQKNNVQLQQETISIFKKDFVDAVKDKVMVMINQKLQQFDITLDPPEFGNMQVRVNLQGEQAAVNFVVQNQQAKDALEQNMHKLREMLAEQGVDVGGANVEQQDQKQNKDENDLGQGKNSSSLLTNEEEAHNVEHVLSAKLFDSSATGVDYYA